MAKKYREPRPEFIRALVAKNTELTESIVAKFVGEDLHDNCNVIIEASSAIPKLRAAEQAMLLEVQQTGALDLQNPKNKQEFLTRLGLNGFDSDYSKDANRAKLENMYMDNIVVDPDKKPVVLLYDNHQIHKSVHADRTKEQAFMDLPPEAQQLYFAHIREHEEMEAQEQQQQAMQAAMMGAPPAPSPSQGQQHQSENIRKGPGIEEKTKKLMGSDLFGPSAGIAQ